MCGIIISLENNKYIWRQFNVKREGNTEFIKLHIRKKYKSFLNTVTDWEEVWISTLPKSKTPATDNEGNILLWHYKEICESMMPSNHISKAIEIHDFLEQCRTLENTTSFNVCPSHTGSYVVSVQQLCLDIQEHLDELE